MLSWKRSYRAAILLLTLVVGSVVAPFSHYAYMALSDAFSVVSAHGHHAHHGDAMAKDAGGVVASHGGALARDAAAGPVFCEYADLFATFAAAALTPLSSSITLDAGTFNGSAPARLIPSPS